MGISITGGSDNVIRGDSRDFYQEELTNNSTYLFKTLFSSSKKIEFTIFLTQFRESKLCLNKLHFGVFSLYCPVH